MSPLTKTLGLVAALLAPTAVLAYTGDMTYYNPGLGACGLTHTDYDAVVALSQTEYGYDPNPNLAEVCGKQIAINYNGLTAYATVADKCWDCASGSIDVSPTVFQQLADPALGRVVVEWNYV